MRILEILFLTLVIFSFFNLFILKNKKSNILIPLATNIIAVFSIIFEGYRIHIVPALILSMLFLICSIVKSLLPKTKHNRVIKLVTLTLLIPILVISVAIPVLFPVVNLPNPKGTYPVGTMFMSFDDLSRRDQLSPLHDYRSIPVQVWYPAADTNEKKRANWINSREAISLFSKCRHLPNVFDHLTLIKTHSYLEANISGKEKKYPVILFSGGWAMFNGQNVVQMEELASQGYIVFAVGHPYEDFACIYPNGKIIPYSEKQSIAISADHKKAVKIAKETVANNENPEYVRTLLRNSKLYNNSARIWSEDMQFIIDKMSEMNSSMSNNIFYGKLDMSNIGAFGHSFGGAAVGQLCLDDSRVKAFINMDGSPFGDAPDKEIIQPFMILTNEKYGKYILYGYSENEKNFLFVQINESEHMNFTDFNSFIPVLGKLSGFLGNIKEERQIEIMNNFILNFFDKYLKDKTPPQLDDSSSTYPEVKISVY